MKKDKKESTSIQQDISEEQLQMINGGCSLCNIDSGIVKVLRSSANTDKQTADNVQQAMRAGKTVAEIETYGAVYRKYINQATDYNARADALEQKIKDRHQ
jgi:hypothetical protein